MKESFKDFHVWEKIKGRLNPESVILIEFIQEWGRSYDQKKVEVFYAEEGNDIIIITVYVFYGKWE